MRLLDNQHHGVPHIHARYGGHEASVGLYDGGILAGKLPRKQLRYKALNMDCLSRCAPSASG
ncbi:DUF4160 domain-containing protein [Halorhodospira halochloris]|uniref:DUF4160 domain-containing protein n=1 Tax=Halorhodospira halochloris TaxID=1052 RepID=UPI001EE93841|nr:DUF4160 domain-containing protein [Halorhodospira halochloris]MCG5530619.1 DUF4160 domain-containing protein [Halorhodospira halochloris]